MATNGHTNGHTNGTTNEKPNGVTNRTTNGSDRFDPDFTKHVVETIGPKADPRTREVMSALFRHVHDFAREVELTIDEWQLGMTFLIATGHMSNKTRNEMHRLSDIIGLESLVDEIANKMVSEAQDVPTSSSILGPFWSPNAPWRQNGESIIQDATPGGQVTLMHGAVIDMVTRRPIADATFDIWQASANGKYDFQDPDHQSDNNLRGKFKTDARGEYRLYCLHPTAYSLPTDGPAGTLLKALDRHPMRPAHIHIMVSAAGYKSVTTQLFPKNDPYLATDTVFAVKDDLVLDFVPLKGDPKAELQLSFSPVLFPNSAVGKDLHGAKPTSASAQ